jgi:hypothetical protein
MLLTDISLNIINALYDISGKTNEVWKSDVFNNDTYSDTLPVVLNTLKVIEEKLSIIKYYLGELDKLINEFLEMSASNLSAIYEKLGMTNKYNILSSVNVGDNKLSVIAFKDSVMNIEVTEITDPAQYSCTSIINEMIANASNYINIVNESTKKRIPKFIENVADQLVDYRKYREDIQKEDTIIAIQNNGKQYAEEFNNSHPLNTLNIDYIRTSVSTIFQACLALSTNFVIYNLAVEMYINQLVIQGSKTSDNDIVEIG